MSDMTIEQYDIEVLRASHKEAERAHQRKLVRIRAVVYSIIALSVALALVGMSYVAYLGLRGPSASDELEQEQKLACIRAEGSWVTLSRGAGDGEGTCFVNKVEME